MTTYSRGVPVCSGLSADDLGAAPAQNSYVTLTNTAGNASYFLKYKRGNSGVGQTLTSEDGVIAMAYEKTCLNTGGLNWAYMNKILTSWHDAGYKTAEQIRTGDRKPAGKSTQRQLDADEQAAIARMLQEV